MLPQGLGCCSLAEPKLGLRLTLDPAENYGPQPGSPTPHRLSCSPHTQGRQARDREGSKCPLAPARAARPVSSSPQVPPHQPSINLATVLLLNRVAYHLIIYSLQIPRNNLTFHDFSEALLATPHLFKRKFYRKAIHLCFNARCKEYSSMTAYKGNTSQPRHRTLARTPGASLQHLSSQVPNRGEPSSNF